MDGDSGILPKQQGGQICFQGESNVIRAQRGVSPLSCSRGGELLLVGQAEAQEHRLRLFATPLGLGCGEAKLVLGQIAFGYHHEFDGKPGTVLLVDHANGSELLDAHFCGCNEAICAAVPRIPHTDPGPGLRQVGGEEAIVAGLQGTLSAQALPTRSQRFQQQFQIPVSPQRLKCETMGCGISVTRNP